MNLLGRGEDSISLGSVRMIVGGSFRDSIGTGGVRDLPTARVTPKCAERAVIHRDHRTGVRP